jgi:ribosome-associated toxin RatA of RatAB toxin-antitoxin module
LCCSAELLAAALALCAALSAGTAHAAQNVAIVAHAEGRAVQVDASATLDVAHDLIWQTLTDYSHLPEFIPGMKMSRIVERRGDTVVVEQEGSARFLAFSHAIKVTVESIEQPPAKIGIRVVKGNLKQLNGGYEIEALPAPRAGFVLRWRGVIEPQLAVPGFISTPLLRANVADQFMGMVKEIERRDAVRRAAVATND